jgi:ubiquitin-protein ligase
VPMSYNAAGGGGGGVGVAVGGSGGGPAMSPPSLPRKVNQELTLLTAGREPGIKVVPMPDRPTHHFTVYMLDPAQQTAEMVEADVLLPDDYPRNPPRVQLPPGRVTADARTVDAQGTVSAPAIINTEWVGIYGENYENQLIGVLRQLHRLIFEAPSPASAPPANLVAQAGGGGAQQVASAPPANLVAQAGGGGAQQVGGGEGGVTGAAPAAQAQPLSGGKPFRISDCHGTSRQYGGFMVGRALDRLRTAPQPHARDWRHTVSSESLAAACRAIGAQGPTKENTGPTKGFRLWNLTDAEVTVS